MTAALPDELLLDIFTHLASSQDFTAETCAVQLRRLLWVCAQWRRVACDASLWRGRMLDLRSAAILANLNTLVNGCSLDLPATDVRLLRGALTGGVRDARFDVTRVISVTAALSIADTIAQDTLALWEPQRWSKEARARIGAGWPLLTRLTLEHCAMMHRNVIRMTPHLTGLTELNIVRCGVEDSVLNAWLFTCVNLLRVTFDPLAAMKKSWKIPNMAAVCPKLREFRVGKFIHGVQGDRRRDGFFNAGCYPALEVMEWAGAPMQEAAFFGGRPQPPPQLRVLTGLDPPLSASLVHLTTLGLNRDGGTISEMALVGLVDRLPSLRELTVMNISVLQMSEDWFMPCVINLPPLITLRFQFWEALQHASVPYFARLAPPGESSGDTVVHELEGGVLVRIMHADMEGRVRYELIRPAVRLGG